MGRDHEDVYAGIPATDISRWFQFALRLSFFMLAVIIIAPAPSASPAILGRWSYPWFAVQLFNIITFLFLNSNQNWLKRRIGYVLVIISTFLVTSNEKLRQASPILQALLPAIRLLVACTIIAAAFDRFRETRRVQSVFLASGFALAAFAVLDLALWVFVATTAGFDPDFEGYRDRYDLWQVQPQDIVIVGDSFVWGHGVRKSERFGNVLERLYADEGQTQRVYSLGVRGAGLDRYLESLGRMYVSKDPGVIVVSFYPNDMPARPKPRSAILQRLETLTWALGHSSLTFRGLHDLLGRIESPTLDRYHASLVADFDPRDPTFATRWDALTSQLGQIADRARAHSKSKPVFLIIPLMVDFRDYPLTDGHDRLRKAAESLSFEVVDLLPEFRDKLGDGRRYRVRPGDNHFDARVHAHVAEILKRRLEAHW
jgi:GDSL-like Lipase/Acylhydrolase family